ncbi:MAG: LacI family DNA-binding transcriptional regulator [Anaerolineales bacterium]
MATTIKDVARKAQVGVGTVSRVINKSPAVSKATRKKVEQAIRDLNYAPNPNARRLSLGKTWHIAVVLPYLTLPSYVERLRGIQEALSNTDYKPILYSVGTPEQRDEYFHSLSHKNHVDGLLAISLSPTQEQAQRFLQNHIPVVLIDARHDQLSHVFVDDVHGGKLATEHLIDLGHERIAYISDYLDYPFQKSAAANRYQGYRQTLQDHSLPYREGYFVQGEQGRENAKTMAKQLLSLEDPPSAIFTSCDTQAIGVLDAAKEIGLKVPGDVSVIGYDGVSESEFVDLTTIAQPLYGSGHIAANMLLHLLASSSPTFKSHQLPVKVIQRGTTGPNHR